MGRKWIGIASALVFLPLAVAADCNSPIVAANIHYDQLGACNGFTKPAALGGGTQTPWPGNVFVVFRIKAISNTDSGAQNFNFDPNKLYLNEDPRPYAIGTYTLGWRNPRAVEARVVKAGTTETFNGTVTLVSKQGEAGTDGAAAAQNTKFSLLYDTPAGTQGTFLTKDNLSKASWNYTNDCADIEKEFPNP